MSDAQPQIYLITPPLPDPERFPDQLAGILDAQAIACVRLQMAGDDAGAIARMADRLREVTHARDVALVIAEHALLAGQLGLDGVHLDHRSRLAGGSGLRKLRADLGTDAIIGVHCGQSRHAGLSAGEAGADYIAFGPVGGTELEDGARAPDDLFAWWSEVVELPVVAEGALRADDVARLAPVTDFFGIGAEIWGDDDPLSALHALTAALR